MSTHKKCPFCAEEIQDEAIKCKHCGESLKVSLAEKNITEKKAQENPHSARKSKRTTIIWAAIGTILVALQNKFPTPLFIVILTCFLVGRYAQVYKKRTGAIWGFLTFIFLLPIWVIMYSGMKEYDSGLANAATIDGGWAYKIAVSIIVSAIIGGIMALIVKSLPRKEQK